MDAEQPHLEWDALFVGELLDLGEPPHALRLSARSVLLRISGNGRTRGRGVRALQ
jgi:hypothetical protein